MPASNYGIIVEGEYDSSAYQAFIRKITSHEVKIVPSLCDGKPNLMRKFPGLLEAFKYQLAGVPIDIAVVIVDADGQDPLGTERAMRSKIADRHYPFEVHCYAVQNAMEAWLLADARAINDVTQRRAGKVVARTHDTPQNLLDPKPVLRKLLEEKRVAYTSAVAAEIAGASDPQVIVQKCPRFRQFAELIDC